MIPVAERAFLDAIAGGVVYLPAVVLAEEAWVLRGYNLNRATRAGALPVLSFGLSALEQPHCRRTRVDR